MSTLKCLAWILVVALLVLSAGDAVLGQASMTEAQKTDLANMFAPRLYLHPDEAFHPVSPEYAISRSDLRNVNTGLVSADPTSSQLSLLTNPDSGYFLDNTMGTVSDDGIMEDFLDSSDSFPPTVYYRVMSDTYNGQSVYVAQYFFYYAFNSGPKNTHEGDWEMVMVICDTSQEPIFAAYSQHLGGERADWELVEHYENHPNVYVALGSHANYYRPYQGMVGPASDSCSASGWLLSPSVYTMVELDESDAGTQWLNFAGCWGDYGSIDSGIMGERGPVGPAYQGDRWDNPLSWADSVNELSEEMLSLNWAMSYVFWMILGIMGIVLLFTILAIYLRKRKQGTLGPRLTPFLYITGANARSAASILAILAIIIGLAGYFMPWYSVTMDIAAGDYTTDGPFEILRTDGIHGLSFNRPEPGAGMVRMVGLPIPFAWLMLFGLFIFVLGTIGIARTRKFGWKLMGRGFTVLMPAIILIAEVSLIGSFISGYVQDAPPEIMDIIDTVSANPLHGTATQTIGSYGTVTLEWGIGPGVIMFMISAIMLFIAAILLIADNKAYFQTGPRVEPTQVYGQAQTYQQPGYYQQSPGYYPPPPPPQPTMMSCPACGAPASAMPGSQPFQCMNCGNWVYPPPMQ